MKEIKLGDIVKFDNEFGLVVDKVKSFDDNGCKKTKAITVFVIGDKEHGERIKKLESSNVDYICHSYDFDNLRRGLPKKISLLAKH